MTFIHSFSTKPLLINCYTIDGMQRLIAQIWYFSTSVAYLKKIGVSIILHTDTLGSKLLGHLPYDEIKLTLDDIPSNINPRFWAAGKFIALKNESAPCIHIDGDVFIKSRKLADYMESLIKTNDVLVQGGDPAIMYEKEAPLFLKHISFCKEHYCEPDNKDALNTGVLGFKDNVVKDKIVDNYFEIVKYFSENEKDILNVENSLTPDLIAEQKMIAGFATSEQIKVNNLLNSPSDADRLNYQHVYSIMKMRTVKLCADTLKSLNNEIYNATYKICSGWFGVPEWQMTFDNANTAANTTLNRHC